VGALSQVQAFQMLKRSITTGNSSPNISLQKRSPYQPHQHPLNLHPLNLHPLNLRPLNLHPLNLHLLSLRLLNLRPLNLRPLNLRPLNPMYKTRIKDSISSDGFIKILASGHSP
jgi:hypothetical protein